ncbi:MAG: hypothetical protein ACR2HA_08595 [Nocardioides sp.]
MSRTAWSVSRRRSTSRCTAAAVAVAALTVAGTGSPAASAPDARCPAPYPVSALAADQPVHGLTVSAGTTPGAFTGKVLGVLQDGIVPGLDMIMVRLSSPEVDRVGIWSGMSGSPVYAADGRLIGAVSYGLAAGPSTVAGLTPAADMQELLSTSATGVMRASAEDVPIPHRLGDRLVQGRVATAAEVDAGLSRLQLPFGMAGLSGKRLGLVARKLDLDIDGMRLGRAGSVSLAGSTSITPGGNIAAAISYGDITAAGTGTVTAVCGEEVLAFGHPMLWTGPSSLSMHAASAVYIQEDPTFSGFKVANIDPTPIGTITQDRMAAILGVLGAGPAAGDITSKVRMLGKPARRGQTSVNLPAWLPDIAFSHILANQDRVFDGIGKGGADFGWTITGTRENGQPFTITRNDVHVSESDITFESAWDVVMALYTLEQNGVEDITIDTVHVDSVLSRDYDRYRFTKAQIRQHGAWTTLTRRTRLRLEAGTRQTFRVTLRSADHGTLRTVKSLRVPRSAEGRRGSLDITGGNGYANEDAFFDEAAKTSAVGKQTFDQILADLEAEPRNDHVLVTLGFSNNRGRVTDQVERRYRTGLVVDGGTSIRVRAIG